VDAENNENRRLIFINMSEILTYDEKRYLRRVCNYLGSLGMTTGVISFEMDSDQIELTSDNIKWEYVTHFQNNYRAVIPDGLKPIIQKIMGYIIKENKLDSINFIDIDMINYQTIDLEIDCSVKEISVVYWFSYYGRGGENSIEYDSTDDIARFERWMENDMSTIEVPDDGILTITYNGGGDSGYIESSFDETGDAVPAGIEDWCYSELESHFGGWEINEGSDGKFIFDFNKSTVLLLHTMNTEESETHTFFEESFNV
jgi:hypothetical protein